MDLAIWAMLLRGFDKHEIILLYLKVASLSSVEMIYILLEHLRVFLNVVLVLLYHHKCFVNRGGSKIGKGRT